MSVIDASSSPSTSNSLLERACEGEPVAWQRIVQWYSPLVYGWARRTGLSPQDASDVTQETFAAVFTGLPRFDTSRAGATFRGWLRSITRNKAADLVRDRHAGEVANGGSTHLEALQNQASAHACSDDSSDPLSQEKVDDKSERREVISRALAILREYFENQTWQAFWRTAVDGCSPDEVADELGMSRWAVYKARARVLQRLRTELRDLEELL